MRHYEPWTRSAIRNAAILLDVTSARRQTTERLTDPSVVRNLRMTQRARLVLGGLILLSVGLSVLAPYALSCYRLNAAEEAIQRYDLEAARDQLALSWSGLSGNGRILLLRAQTARRLDDCALAERLLTDYERRHGATEEF